MCAISAITELIVANRPKVSEINEGVIRLRMTYYVSSGTLNSVHIHSLTKAL